MKKLTISALFSIALLILFGSCGFLAELFTPTPVVEGLSDSLVSFPAALSNPQNVATVSSVRR